MSMKHTCRRPMQCLPKRLDAEKIEEIVDLYMKAISDEGEPERSEG